MDYKNEHQRQMAILEAAIPYVAPDSRHAIEMLLQTNTLINLAHQDTSDFNLEAAETGEQNSPNPQALLTNIQDYLTPRESDLVKTILNFMNANHLFRNYQEFARTHSTSQDDEAELSSASLKGNSPLQTLFELINGLGSFGTMFSAASSSANHASNNASQNNLLKDFILSQMNPEQKTTFEQIQSFMYNEGGNHENI